MNSGVVRAHQQAGTSLTTHSSYSAATLPTTALQPPESHYTSHDAASYESAYFYEPGPYMEYLKDLVQNRVFGFQGDDDEDQHQQQQPQLLDNDKSSTIPRKMLLDIGGGTGNFTKLIIERKRVNAIVIDPFLEQSSSVTTGDKSRIQFVKEPAEAFMVNKNTNKATTTPFWKHNYDYVLLKEVVHHFNEADRISIFRGLYDGLNPITTSSPSASVSSSLLIITRPQKDIDYPLWEEARTIWAQNQPSADQFVFELNEAGFTNIQQTVYSYPCTIQLHRWQNMIQSRFWSTFSNFSDQELEIACQSIADTEKHRIHDGILNFNDKLVFISACKNTR